MELKRGKNIKSKSKEASIMRSNKLKYIGKKILCSKLVGAVGEIDLYTYVPFDRQASKELCITRSIYIYT
jgi:hypothetical protein